MSDAARSESGLPIQPVYGGRIAAEQSVFGGATVVHSAVRHGTPVITVRPNSVAPEPAPAAAELSNVEGSLDAAARGARITGRVVQERGERPELSEAAIVVSGGAANSLIRPLAAYTGPAERHLAG